MKMLSELLGGRASGNFSLTLCEVFKTPDRLREILPDFFKLTSQHFRCISPFITQLS